MVIKLIVCILNLIFPPKCHICGKMDDHALCPECLSGIKILPPCDGDIRSVGIYEGVLRTAIKKFKFKKKKKLAIPLAQLIAVYMRVSGLQERIDFIVPVPLSKKRMRSRGFNQVELLSDIVSAEIGIPSVHDVIIRNKETKPQFELKREERFNNVSGAFKVCCPERLSGRLILLMDDIYTTGATVSECSKALMSAGAEKVYALALAKALE